MTELVSPPRSTSRAIARAMVAAAESPRAPAVAVACLAILVSLSGLSNGFTYDDIHVIQENALVHDLSGAWRFLGQPYWPPPRTGEVYRPLTILLFAIQWALGGGAPLIFHAFSIALYAATCVAVLKLARVTLPAAPGAALAAAALFAVHPVHVESVANVVGQSELLVALFLASALTLYVRWRRRAPSEPLGARRIAVLVVLYVAACLSKEHGIVLPALLALAELLLVPREGARSGSARSRLRALAPLAIALLVVAAGYLAVRTVVVGGIGGATSSAFQGRPLEDRLLTALGGVPHWVRLLLWPASLSADYSPQHVVVRTALGAEAAAALAVLCAVPLLAVLLARRIPAASYAIGFVIVAILPVSNLLVQTGILVAERTLFLPSVGAVLLAGALLARIGRPSSQPARLALGAALLALVLLGAWRSAIRQPVWRDNRTLFAQTLRDAPLSYRSHWLWGMTLAADDDLEGARRELKAAVLIFPRNGLLQLNLGGVYRANGQCAAAMNHLQRAAAMLGTSRLGTTYLADCSLRLARFREGARWARRGLASYPGDSSLALLARAADSILVARDSVPDGASAVPPVTPRTAMRPTAAPRSSDR